MSRQKIVFVLQKSLTKPETPNSRREVRAMAAKKKGKKKAAKKK
jgi:hypothetical protein